MPTRSISITYPLQDDLEKNRLLQMDTTAKESVKSQLLFLLSTPKGSRWYTPDFGTNLQRYLFEPNDSPTWDAVIAEVQDTVGKYIPNMTITKMDTQKGNTDYSLLLNVQYVYSEGYYRESDLVSVNFSAAR